MTQMTDGRSLVYPTAEAARLIHPDLSPRTLERWRTTGQGPAYVRVGRRVGYRLSDIEAYLDRQTRQHTGEGR